MGYNTVVVLRNDFTRDIAACGDLGTRIAEAMQNWYGRRNPIDLDFNAGQVISLDHADGWQVTVVHGNTGWRLDHAPELPWSALDQMQRCLERHGYRVTKCRKLKAPSSPMPAGDGK